MAPLKGIDLGKDDAENDANLEHYFLETDHYGRAYSGAKTIVVGGKGSGKSAIFRLLQTSLNADGQLAVPMTVDQHGWQVVKECTGSGMPLEFAHTTAWRLTLLTAVVERLGEEGRLTPKSRLAKLYMRLRKGTPAGASGAFHWVKRVVTNLETQWLKIDWKEVLGHRDTPDELAQGLADAIEADWPPLTRPVRVLIDRVDECWDGSESARAMVIGLLKACQRINDRMQNLIVITVFIRDDIYDHLVFDDQDKLRQYEERLRWDRPSLKKVVEARVQFSLQLPATATGVWESIFSDRPYRGRMSAETYMLDRTFMRPRDLIAFVRLAILQAIRQNHVHVEPDDTRRAEQESYSSGKYRDIIVEHQRHFAEIQQLLDAFAGSFHKLSKTELFSVLSKFAAAEGLKASQEKLLADLFAWGVVGVRKYVPATQGQPGRERFVYGYDDPLVRVLDHREYYIHPGLRPHLRVSEKREKRLEKGKKRLNPGSSRAKRALENNAIITP